MATGDQNDMVNRQKAVMPPWFPFSIPFLGAALDACANTAVFAYSFLQQAASQTRIRTQSGGFLDLTAWDFFGGRFRRRNGELDAVFEPRVIAEILRPRQTRAALIRVVQDLTTRTPKIIELFNPADVGGYDVASMGGYDVGNVLYADLTSPQYLMDAYRSPSQGVPLVGGYDTYNAAYDTGVCEYVDMSQVTGQITDAEIYARIAETTAAGVQAWVALHDNPAAALLVTKEGIALVSETTGSQLTTDS